MARLFVDGSQQWIGCGDVASLSGVSTFTLTAWMKRTSANDPVEIYKIYNDSSDLIGITQFTDGNLYFLVYNGGASYGYVANNTTDWVHVALVFDGGETGNDRVRGYVNGALASLSYSGSFPATTDDNASDLELGRVDLSTDRFSDGCIAEVRIYTDALTLGQIKTDYTGLIAGNSLANHWRLGVADPEPCWAGSDDGGALVNTPAIADHPPVMNPYGMDDSFISAEFVTPTPTGPPVGTLSMMGVGR